MSGFCQFQKWVLLVALLYAMWKQFEITIRFSHSGWLDLTLPTGYTSINNFTISDQVERQKLKTEEGSMRLSAEKSRLDRSLNTTEQELQEAQQQILMLQVGSSHWSALHWHADPHWDILHVIKVKPKWILVSWLGTEVVFLAVASHLQQRWEESILSHWGTNTCWS